MQLVGFDSYSIYLGLATEVAQEIQLAVRLREIHVPCVGLALSSPGGVTAQGSHYTSSVYICFIVLCLRACLETQLLCWKTYCICVSTVNNCLQTIRGMSFKHTAVRGAWGEGPCMGLLGARALTCGVLGCKDWNHRGRGVPEILAKCPQVSVCSLWQSPRRATGGRDKHCPTCSSSEMKPTDPTWVCMGVQAKRLLQVEKAMFRSCNAFRVSASLSAFLKAG